MATTTYGTEYVQSSDLVSNWPGSSLNVANRIDNVSLVGNGVNNQTGTSYTLVLTDGGKLVTFSNAAAIALTVPTNASVAFPTGVSIKLTNKGAGTVTVAGAGGVTLNGNQLTIAQNRSAMLYKLDTNTWVMTADGITPADPGLAFITAQTFTSSSAVSVNNCFTSTYQNYKIIFNTTTSGTSIAMSMRLRVSSSDNTTTNYRSGGIFSVFTGSAVAATNYNAATAWTVHVNTQTSGNSRSMDILDPQSAARTIMASIGSNGDANAYYGGIFDADTQFDGFTLYPASGTFTGTLRVYGYRNS